MGVAIFRRKSSTRAPEAESPDEGPSLVAELLDIHARDRDGSAHYEEWVGRLHERRVLLQRTVAEIDGRLAPRPDPTYWQPEQVFVDSAPDATVSGDVAPAPAEVLHALEVLGLSVGASADDVATQFRRAVKLHHPDIHAHADDATRAAHTAQFRAANEAMNVLRRAASIA